MDGLTVINEIMAVLGFMIPSSVLWVVWQIRASFNEIREHVQELREDVAWLKRHQEDQDLLDEHNKT